MGDFRSKLRKWASYTEIKIDDFWLSVRKRLGTTDPVQVITFRSYGTVNRLYVKGRVLEQKNIRQASEQDSLWSNLLSMYRRFESDEVPGAKLKLMFQGHEYFVTTDHEGYFVLNLAPDAPIDWQDMWHEIEIELIESPVSFTPGTKSVAHVLVPPADAEYGIISDIDDTIVQTGATSLLAMSRNTFFHNAHTRLPFAGVAEFYRALQLGRNGKRNNPFFYVSSSPWNLYDLLIDFMDLNNIPEGPLLLRDFGFGGSDGPASDHMGHKFKEIGQILDAYPHLKFVLIGDSGQEDPSIYREVVRKFPDRILAVYIRDVQLPDREKIALEISRSIDGPVEMVIVDNTVEAADHAAKNKLIFTAQIPDIVEDKKQDKGERQGKEPLSS
jgi:phosphatidate phosphatase APP1